MRRIAGLVLLHRQARDGFALLDHLVNGEAFFRERAGGAGLDAFAAAGAVARVAPVVFEIADDAGVDAARGDLPHMRSFHLSADPDAAGAEDAAIVIEDKARVAHVHGQARVVVGIAHVGDAERLRHGLQFAVAVRDAGGADVVALDEQQLDGHAAILRELCRRGLDGHAVLDGRGAGGQQAVGSGELDHADAACADCAEALEIAERGNLLAVGAGRFKNGVALVRGDQLTINAD